MSIFKYVVLPFWFFFFYQLFIIVFFCTRLMDIFMCFIILNFYTCNANEILFDILCTLFGHKEWANNRESDNYVSRMRGSLLFSRQNDIDRQSIKLEWNTNSEWNYFSSNSLKFRCRDGGLCVVFRTLRPARFDKRPSRLCLSGCHFNSVSSKNHAELHTKRT